MGGSRLDATADQVEAAAVFTDAVALFPQAVFFTQIIVPFAVLLYCTVRIVNRLRKKTVGDKAKLRRAVCVVMSVAALFSICFIPCTIARAALLSVRLRNDQGSEDVAVQVYDGLMALSYLDCLLDPLVYCFCNSGFKDAYASVFCPGGLRRADLGTGAAAHTSTTSGARNVSTPIIEK